MKCRLVSLVSLAAILIVPSPQPSLPSNPRRHPLPNPSPFHRFHSHSFLVFLPSPPSVPVFILSLRFLPLPFAPVSSLSPLDPQFRNENSGKGGESGKTVPLYSNSFQVDVANDWWLYQYVVHFSPEQEGKRIRKQVSWNPCQGARSCHALHCCASYPPIYWSALKLATCIVVILWVLAPKKAGSHQRFLLPRDTQCILGKSLTSRKT